VLISGNSAWGRPAERFGSVSAPGARLLFASTRWGFGVLEVGDAGNWSYRFVDDAGKSFQCCTASARGRCEPVACPP
jgi:tartrate-resistant acid phosphatase type 5